MTTEQLWDQSVTGPDDPRLTGLLGRLTLEEKVRVLTGRDMWSTHPLPSIGLRSIVLSDGPSGVRGAVWDERSPSLNLPSATALSASWDEALAVRYGAAAAAEARRKDVDVVLGPTINLHRSPLGGRHFEAFSEDPLLTGDLAAAVVHGLQDNGVGATPKHYVANDSETERFTADVRVSERTLREVYLLAFERAVAEAGAWLVMSAYNAVNGTTASEHELLETPLNSEWGFDGVVVSDWTAVRSLAAAEAAQDLEMPGPDGAWGDALVAAVRDGRIDEADVDRKVLRILTLAARVGALEGFPAPAAPAPVDGRALAREVAAEGMVLVRNESLLPVRASDVRRIAVLGHNAVQARTQGGGSATVVPAATVSPLEGIRAAFPDAEVTHALGAVVQQGVAGFDLDTIENPVTGGPGARVRLLDVDGGELLGEDRYATELVYAGGDPTIVATHAVELTTRWTPTFTGPVRIGCGMVGSARLFLDGELAAELDVPLPSEDPGAAVLGPPSATTRIEVEAGRAVDVRVVFVRDTSGAAPAGAFGFTVGTEPVVDDPDGLIAEAADVAAAADLAVVVVGTNHLLESEGHDRTELALPGRQDDLVAAVAAANPDTVVVVNAGAPVLLPWRDDVAAVLLGWFGGQEFGAALGDVLTGAREPGGRLPTTWPATTADVPVLDVVPQDGVLAYDEGIHVGYRAWLRAGTTPAYAFGHGLGYTTWALGMPTVTTDDAGVRVTVPVTNTGDRDGKTVVQVYAARPDSAVDRPVRWLVGHAVVRAPTGATADAAVRLDRRRFAHWDAAAGDWAVEPGAFVLHVGTAVDALEHTAAVEFH